MGGDDGGGGNGDRAIEQLGWARLKTSSASIFSRICPPPHFKYFQVLESYNYFSLSRIFTLYFSEEFGFSDVAAGSWYGVWGTLLTAYGFVLGGAIDFIGVKRSLILCFLLNVTSRFVMASTTSRTVLLVALLGPNTMAGKRGEAGWRAGQGRPSGGARPPRLRAPAAGPASPGWLC